MTTSEQTTDAVSTRVFSAESPSEGVVRAVAAAADCKPVADGESTATDVLDPLYTAIDPDALDALFQPTDSDGAVGRVRFRYQDHHVTVTSDGRITVEPDT